MHRVWCRQYNFMKCVSPIHVSLRYIHLLVPNPFLGQNPTCWNQRMWLLRVVQCSENRFKNEPWISSLRFMSIVLKLEWLRPRARFRWLGAPRAWTLGPPIYNTLHLKHSIYCKQKHRFILTNSYKRIFYSFDTTHKADTRKHLLCFKQRKWLFPSFESCKLFCYFSHI